MLDKVLDYLSKNAIEIIAITIALIILAAIAKLIDVFKNLMGKNRNEESNPLPNERKIFDNDNYIHSLISRASTVSFGSPSLYSLDETKENLVTLEKILMPLRVADSKVRDDKLGTHENMIEESEGIDLFELFNSVTDNLVILGEPGSGKSTSLASLVLKSSYKFRKNNTDLLPVWISLSSVQVNSNIKSLFTGCNEIYTESRDKERLEKDDIVDYLYTKMIKGEVLLLLDGLDEIEGCELTTIRNHISKIVNTTKTRTIVTCRLFDYRELSPIRKIPINREIQLLPYNEKEQEKYIKQWYIASVSIGRFNPIQAEELENTLLRYIKKKELKELGQTPLLLTLLILVHSKEAKLPDAKAVLCDKAISYMLEDSAKWRIREASKSIVATPPIKALAVEVAYKSYSTIGLDNNKKNVEITYDLINEISSNICNKMKSSDTSKSVPLKEDLTNRLIKGHGLLLNIGNHKYKFSHKFFQEFLVSQYFASGSKHKDALIYSSKIYWREPFILMASYAGHEGANLYYIVSLIKDLLLSKEVASQHLASEMLGEIGKRRFSLQNFDDIINDKGIWVQAQKLLLSHIENYKIPLFERYRAAKALNNLGDLRVINHNSIINNKHYSYYPETKFNVGSSSLDSNILSKSGAFVNKIREIEIYEFYLSKYLVTNMEYRKFIEDDGYINQDYWIDPIAKGWLTGDEKIINDIKNHWLLTLHEHHRKEMRDEK